MSLQETLEFGARGYRTRAYQELGLRSRTTLADYDLGLRSRTTISGYASDYGLGVLLGLRLGLRLGLHTRTALRSTFSDYATSYRSPKAEYVLVYKYLILYLDTQI